MLTTEEFEALISNIDSDLSTDDIEFYKRPLNAFSKLTTLVDPKGSFKMSSDNEVSLEDYSNDALCVQVHRWYEKTYGNRIKIHLGPGSYILMIKNEPWEVIFPLCFGENSFTIDSDLSNTNRKFVTDSGKSIPSVNILCHVNDMTSEIAKNLSIIERQAILSDYMFGLNAIQSLRDIKEAPFMEQAANDYDTSVSNIFHKYPDYNNSKWAALQFAEKSMKSYLKLNNVKFGFNHDLASLAKLLKLIGVSIQDQDIDNIQCKAAVRYGEINVTRKEAILAVKSALSVFSHTSRDSAYSYEL